ncbi:MAG: IPT/TIG domain-containing protein [Kofleriaceae bacterium]
MHRIACLVVVVACGGPGHPEPAPVSNTSVAPQMVTPDAAPSDPSLAITGVEPERGDAGGGTYVVVKGRGFIKMGPRMAKVYFGTLPGAIVRFQSDTEIIVQSPGGTAGEKVDVRVIFDPGGERVLPHAFQHVDAPPTP